MGIVETYLIGPFAEMAAHPAGVLETVIAGLGNGFLYALVAIGFVIIFKSSGVFNYAQGAIVFFAALNFAGLLQLGLPWYLAGLATLLMLVLVAVVVERAVLRSLVGQSPLTLFMATIGISFFIEGLVEAVWGGNPHMLKIGLPESSLFTIDYAWAETAERRHDRAGIGPARDRGRPRAGGGPVRVLPLLRGSARRCARSPTTTRRRCRSASRSIACG